MIPFFEDMLDDLLEGSSELAWVQQTLGGAEAASTAGTGGGSTGEAGGASSGGGSTGEGGGASQGGGTGNA